ncbi:chaperone modulator CbpM [uncultured Psychromonas sp.]|uniref:chaperone modulator CbpM n=1 Tax=uncultured Psychromonas sp. TaxID=173974 RepID=UPI002629C651|nr:chaperone modulator CbpM [uncultured Psychromonas sp.]
MMRRLTVISLNELCQLERIESHHIIEIVENGIVKPIANANSEDWEFDTSSVHWIKKAVRLHQDLEIDWLAVALLIDLIQQRDSLQREKEFYQQQLRRFTQH